jgi:hypothetical protein
MLRRLHPSASTPSAPPRRRHRLHPRIHRLHLYHLVDIFFNVGVSSCIAYRSPRVEGKTEGVDASNANWRLSSTAAAVIAAVCTFISIIIQLSFVKWSIELSFGRDSFIQHHSLSLSLVYIQKEKEKHQKEKDGRTVRWCSNRLRNGGFHVKVCRHFFSQEP